MSRKRKLTKNFFCEQLPRTTTAKDVFKLVKGFFNKHNLDFKMISSICTDGAPAMLSNYSGFAAMLKKGDTRVKSNPLSASPTGSCLQNTTSMSLTPV